jgi:hypothetical protein
MFRGGRARDAGKRKSGASMTGPDRIRLTVTFPELTQAEAAERVDALRRFAQSRVQGLEFVSDQPEGHLGVGLTFTVMLAVPAARLLWKEYFSDFQPRQPGKVCVEVDGTRVFEGHAADPDQFPAAPK